MKRKLKHKLWLDRRSRKLQEKHKKNRLISRGRRGNTGSKSNSENKLFDSEGQSYVAKAPECFSFVRNPEETISYFSDILFEIGKKQYRQNFFLDTSSVTSVTTDALIYILAILYNIKTSRVMKYRFSGNLPNDIEARKVFIESGFLRYVETKKIIVPETKNNVQIEFGRKADPDVPAKICDFVNNQFCRNNLFTLGLYQTLVELMSNTAHHAYNSTNNTTQPYWYLYAVHKGNSIQFTFIDTGEGIPRTVKRKFLERVASKFVTDSSLIKSAFLGESRTETGQYNRGHGLPAMYEKVKSGKLTNFYVLSGKGNCILRREGSQIIFEEKNYSKEVFGTIIQFDIKK